MTHHFATSLLAALSLATGAAFAADPNPCRLLTPAEVTAALGSAPSVGKPHPPSRDEELKATAWSCEQYLGKMLLSTNAIQFASPAAATRGMAAMLKSSRDVPEAIKLSAAPGIGEESAWGASPDGALWVARKGRYLVNVTVAGGLADPLRYREPLKQLMLSAIGRLPP